MNKHVYNLKPDDIQDYVKDYKFGDLVRQDKLPSKASLRDKFKFVLDQLNLGSCGLNAGVMYLLFLHSFNIPMLSRLYAYYKVRELEGTTEEDSGVSLRDVCKVFQKNGVCLEELYKYIVENFRNKPTPEMDENAKQFKIKSYHRANSINEVKQAIVQGYPVLIGMAVFEEMESEEVARTGIVPMPKNPNKCLGGHAILLEAFEDIEQPCGLGKLIKSIFRIPVTKGYFENLNSWGENWGDHGFFKFSYEYFEKYVSDAWVLVLE